MMSAAPQRPADVDPTVYPVEDDVGEGILQRLIIWLLLPLVEQWIAGREKRPVLVGSDQFIYWVQHEPTRCVSPDIYVMPGVPQDTVVGAWKLWEMGSVPSFALEVVSDDVRKDYERSPRRYAELGVKELVIFDPHSAASADRVRWQVYRKQGRQEFGLSERPDDDRVRSSVLGCWLRVVGEGDTQRIRLATGARGDEIVPTALEAAHDDVRRLLEENERLKRPVPGGPCLR